MRTVYRKMKTSKFLFLASIFQCQLLQTNACKTQTHAKKLSFRKPSERTSRRNALKHMCFRGRHEKQTRWKNLNGSLITFAFWEPKPIQTTEKKKACDCWPKRRIHEQKIKWHIQNLQSNGMNSILTPPVVLVVRVEFVPTLKSAGS